MTAYQTALGLLSDSGDLRGAGLALAGRARLSSHDGDTASAITGYEQALSAFRDVGDTRQEPPSS